MLFSLQEFNWWNDNKRLNECLNIIGFLIWLPSGSAVSWVSNLKPLTTKKQPGEAESGLGEAQSFNNGHNVSAIWITILINIVNAHVKNIEKMTKKWPYDSSASDDP